MWKWLVCLSASRLLYLSFIWRKTASSECLFSSITISKKLFLVQSKEVNPFCSKLCKTVKSGGLRCLQRSSTLIFQATISSATATFLTNHITFDHITSVAWHLENGQLYTTSSTWSLILWWNSMMMLISETTGWCEFILLWGGEVLTRPSGRTG